MSEQWGATENEWDMFLGLGLSDDILPVVSKQNSAIASYSSMKQLGKTPSQYNDRNQVVGIAKWTQRTAHKNEIEAWRKEKDYGICIQTRHMRALDIDVEDKDKAQDIVNFIQECLNATLPLRFRKNSGKCLTVFFVPGELGKRVVKVEGGMVEFLANGQQFIAAGTHPSGARYEWSFKSDRMGVKRLTAEQFDYLWTALCERFGTEAPIERGLRNYNATDVTHTDATAKFLVEEGHGSEIGNDGQIFIECPFADGHSTESCGTDSAYFPAGSGGYEQGHFKCLHASCEGRKDFEFEDAFELRAKDFEPIEDEEVEKAGSAVVEVGETAGGLEAPTWSTDKHGRPKAILYNIRLAVERAEIAGFTPKYDKFKDEIIFYKKDGTWVRAADEILIEMRMRLESIHQFPPISRDLMRDAVLFVANKRTVDTAIEWLSSLEWDGVPRVESFLMKYLGCEDSEYYSAVSNYLWSGLAGRVMEPGVKADMIPVLVSPEGYMKSSAIEAMAPTPNEFVEVNFSERDADLARRMKGKMVAELAELRGLRTRALEGILAFVTRRFEEWIPKYRENATSFPRRLMFIATTNEEEFLEGSGQHRRWLPIRLNRHIDLKAVKRDRDQLWAEARGLFKKRGVCFAKAEELARDNRAAYRTRDSWEDAVAAWLDTSDGLDGVKPGDRKYVSLLDVALRAIGLHLSSIKRPEELRIAKVLRTLGYTNTLVREGGSRMRVWVKEG